MICQWLDVYKNGVLLTDTTGLWNGDILTVTVRTDRRPGYIFVGWVGLNGERLNPYPTEVVGTEFPTFVFNLTCDTYINALFRKGVTEMVTISVVSNNEELGTVSGGATVEIGTEVTIEATAGEPCYSRFVCWTKKSDGEVVSTDPVYTVIATENKLYEAIFEYIEYTINLTSSHINRGTVSQSGTIYHLDDIATLTATPAENCTFDGWYEDGQLISSDLVYSYRIEAEGETCETRRNIQGKFRNELYEVNAYFDENEISEHNITII